MSEIRINRWNAAIYIRISKDNGEDTLEIQESTVRKHLSEIGNIQIHSVKVDDGYSGLNCNRPAFQEMLAEIESGEINCVAVRDLSRFSRNHIDAGCYIQQIFPALGVRFISVLENMDFLTAPKHNDLLMLGVKTFSTKPIYAAYPETFKAHCNTAMLLENIWEHSHHTAI